jgi:ASC-1-like (ASCH) protein
MNNIPESYTFSVNEPWFSFIKKGKKKIEGRLNKGKFKELKVNDIIKFKHGFDSVIVKITKINKYKSFKEYLVKEQLKTTLPKIKTIDAGVSVYRKFYSEEDEIKFGILAIHIELLNK